jgi:hypothetical protein
VDHKISQVVTPLLVFRSFVFHNAPNEAKVGSRTTTSYLAAEFLGSARSVLMGFWLQLAAAKAFDRQVHLFAVGRF